MNRLEALPLFTPGVHLIIGLHARKALGTIVGDITSNMRKTIPLQKALLDTKYLSGSYLNIVNDIGYVYGFGANRHYREIKDTMDFMFEDSKRTWFCDTIHPWVVDRASIESAKDAQKRLLFAPKDNGGLYSMSEDEALRLWEAYEVKIQQLSEIFTSDGYW